MNINIRSTLFEYDNFVCGWVELQNQNHIELY